MARTAVVEVAIPAGRLVNGQDLITVPFEPQGAILVWNGRAESGNAQGRASHRRGVGLWTPSACRCLATGSKDAATPAVARADLAPNPTVVELLAGNDVITGASDAGAVIDHGDGTFSIPLTCSTAYTEATRVIAWVIGDVTACDLVSGNYTASPLVLSTPSGAADALLLCGSTLTSNSSGTDAGISLGLAARSGGQGYVLVGSNNGSNPSVANQSGSLSAILADWNGGVTGVFPSGAVSAWDADGIEVTLSATTAASVQCFGLAIIGCSAALQTIPLPAGVQQESQVALDFEAAGAFLLAGNGWGATGGVRSHDQMCVGAVDHAGAQAALSTLDVDQQSPTVVATSIRHGECFVRQSQSATPTNAAALAMKSIDPTAVTFLATMVGDGLDGPLGLFLGPDTSGPPPLTAGVATLGAVQADEVQASATEATGGTAPYTHQWQRSEDDGATWEDLAGQTTLALDDTTAVEGTPYQYRLAYTDSAGTPATQTSNVLSATPHAAVSTTLTLEEPMLAVRQRGVAATLPVPCKNPSTGAYLTTNPLAPGDVTLSADGAAPVVLADDANAGTWPFRNGRVYIPLSAAEMAGDYLTLQIEDRDASAYISPPVDVELTDDDKTRASATLTEVVDAFDSDSVGLATLISGQADTQSALGDIGNRTALIPDDPTAVSDLPPAPDNVGIAAIKAKTDALVVAGGAVAASLSDAERNAVAAALMDLESAIDSFTPRQVLALLAARSLGKGVNLDTATPSFLAIDGSKPRVTGDVSDPATRNVALDAS